MTTMAMTFPQTYAVQFSFHFDETQRLLALARALPDDVYRAEIDYSHASMHNTFAHLLIASRLWRNVLAGTAPSPFEPEALASIAGLDALFASERAGWHDLITTYDAAALLETIERPTPFGTKRLMIWQTLQHVILHGMAHHTELARMLTEAGQQPNDIDFLFYQQA